MGNISIINGANLTISPSATQYSLLTVAGAALVNASETGVNRKFLHAATLSKLTIHISSNTISASSTIRTRINSANGNMLITVPSSTTGTFQDLVNTDTIVSGDTVGMVIIGGAGGTNAQMRNYGCEINNTSNSESIQAYRTSANTLPATANTTFYNAPISQVAFNVSELTEFKFKSCIAGTRKSLQIYVTSNGRSTSTTFGSRLNGANGNLSLSVPASSTGLYEDTSNSDTIVLDDLYNLYATTGSGSGDLVYNYVMSCMSTTNDVTQAISVGLNNLSANTTFWEYLNGRIGGTSTESFAQTYINQSCTVDCLRVYISSNPNTGTTTVTARKNGVNTSRTLSITSGATGWFEDMVNSDSLVSGDLYNFRIVTGATGGATQFYYIANKVTFTYPAVDNTTNFFYMF